MVAEKMLSKGDLFMARKKRAESKLLEVLD